MMKRLDQPNSSLRGWYAIMITATLVACGGMLVFVDVPTGSEPVLAMIIGGLVRELTLIGQWLFGGMNNGSGNEDNPS